MTFIVNSRTVGTVDGFDITAHTVPDNETSIYDYTDGANGPFDEDTTDPLEQAVIAAFWRGDWNYVGTVVTASRCGIELGSASIWGQECGTYPTAPDGNGPFVDPLDGTIDTFANGYGPDLIAEAIDNAKAKLAEFTTTTTTEGN